MFYRTKRNLYCLIHVISDKVILSSYSKREVRIKIKELTISGVQKSDLIVCKEKVNYVSVEDNDNSFSPAGYGWLYLSYFR